MPKFYNVVSTKTIINDNTNTEKKIYHKVGVLKVTSNGGWFLQMYHQPDVNYQVFSNHQEELPVINIEDNA